MSRLAPAATLTLTDPGAPATDAGHVRRRAGGGSRSLTTVEYTIEQRAALNAAAQERDLSKAEIQRQALQEWLERRGITVAAETVKDARLA